MADNVRLNVGVNGELLATDDIAGVQHQRVKIEFGVDGAATDVSSSNPMPVVQTGTPSLPTGASTAAKQPALGIAGTASADVITVQGKAGMVPLLATVTGSLTDTELRASPVPVSGPATNVELRASPLAVLLDEPIAVSGPVTNTELRAVPVNVLGPVTNTELRAVPVNVAGPLTDTQLRTSPVPVSGPLTNSELRLTAVPVSGPLTDTQIRANPIIVDTELPAAIELADGLANPTTPVTGSCILAWNGTTWSRVKTDKITGALTTVSYEHHEVHSGSFYNLCEILTLGSGVSQNYLFTTPDTTVYSHFGAQVVGSGKVTVSLYEGADRTGVALLDPKNHNRNSSNTASLIVHKGYAAGTTDGTLLCSQTAGYGTNANNVVTGVAGTGQEWILKRNTKYVFTVLSGTADQAVSIVWSWYEHTSL